MYFNMLTLAAIRQEMEQRIVGGRVQAIIQPDALSLGLEIYAERSRHHLLLSAESTHPRLHFLTEKPRRGTDVPSPLLLRLRRYLDGARLTAIQQPPWERILHMEFHRGDAAYVLIAEIMGRHSNLILTDSSGTILECMKRVGPDRNRYRTILPNQPYTPPPPQEKRPITEWDEGQLAQALKQEQAKGLTTERALVRLVRGLSPLAAREVLGRAATPDPAALLSCVRDLFAPLANGEWTPSVGLDGEEAIAYAPYALTHLRGHRLVASTSEAIETYLASRHTLDPYAAARAAVEEALNQARQALKRRRVSLERGVKTPQEVQALLEKGQVLLAHLHEVDKGKREITLPGLSGDSIQIALNPKLSPVENAQRYFKAYQKAQAALREVPQRLDALGAEEAYLAQLKTDLALAESRPEIDAVMAALTEGGYVRGRKPRPHAKPARPLSFRSPDGLVVVAGRNSRQNEEVTFKVAAPDDVWLHVRGRPGAHVVIRSGGRPVPETTLRFAAQIAAFYSAARGEKTVQVDWTRRKHVRRLPGGKPGMVRYSHEASLMVEPSIPDE